LKKKSIEEEETINCSTILPQEDCDTHMNSKKFILSTSQDNSVQLEIGKTSTWGGASQILIHLPKGFAHPNS